MIRAILSNPNRPDLDPVYDGTNLSELKDDEYSVKLKLASASNKEGVWLRLPDYAEVNSGRPDELRIALDTLGVSSLQECRALEAVCVLPNIRNLLEQYDSLDKLVWDGSNLGYSGIEQWYEFRTFFLEFTDSLVFCIFKPCIYGGL